MSDHHRIEFTFFLPECILDRPDLIGAWGRASRRPRIGRHFLQSSLIAACAASLPAAEKRPPRILLRSSWQTIDIGDIAHTPGVLALIEKHLSDAEVRLWPSDVSHGVKEMLQRRFPKLIIVEGAEALKAALSDCDFLLHGSGPYLVVPSAIQKWTQETGKPYGVYGITLFAEKCGELEVELLSKARFVYFRDSVSLQLAKEKGVTLPVMEFAPDGAFGVDLRDDAKASACLAEHGLADGRFLCCIPRYRHVPEWVIPRKKKVIDQAKHEKNERWKEHDHAPLREAIIRVVRETPMKVLICPEDETQMTLGKEMLFDFDIAAEVKAMPAAVLAMAKDPAAAKAKAAMATGIRRRTSAGDPARPRIKPLTSKQNPSTHRSPMNTPNRRQFFSTLTAASGLLARRPLHAADEDSSTGFREAARDLPLNNDADVIVCGAGPTGVTAAITAAHAGAKVRLFEAHGSLGGVWTSSLLGYLLDFDKPGFNLELVRRLREREAINGDGMNGLSYQPEEMKLLLEELCADAGVNVQIHTHVTAAYREGRALIARDVDGLLDPMLPFLHRL